MNSDLSISQVFQLLKYSSNFNNFISHCISNVSKIMVATVATPNSSLLDVLGLRSESRSTQSNKAMKAG
jgi:hypothetical protein